MTRLHKLNETLEVLYKESLDLKNSIELIEFLQGQRNTGKGLILEHLVKKFVNVKVKMYQEHHNLPHVHIDIGNQNHCASITIENPRILSGSLDKKYQKVVLKWIEKNEANLMIIWDNIQDGQIFDLSTLN